MNYVLIVAGGVGKRMNSQVPKQFLMLDDKPILYYTVHKFLQALPDYKIILVLPADTFSTNCFLAEYFPEQENIIAISGGETRFHSVQNGLNVIEGDGLVLIHDGVRPFVSDDVLKRCIQTASSNGNAIPCVALNDSLRCIDGEHSIALDRTNYRSVQTPQTFRIAEIKQAYEQTYQVSFTDEAAVYEAIGGKINIVEGNDENIKITTPQDLVLAEYFIKL